MLALALAIAFGLALFGCWEMPPGNVPLSTAGEEVEILTEMPSEDIYESFEQLSVQAIGST